MKEIDALTLELQGSDVATEVTLYLSSPENLSRKYLRLVGDGFTAGDFVDITNSTGSAVECIRGSSAFVDANTSPVIQNGDSARLFYSGDTWSLKHSVTPSSVVFRVQGSNYSHAHLLRLSFDQAGSLLTGEVNSVVLNTEEAKAFTGSGEGVPHVHQCEVFYNSNDNTFSVTVEPNDVDYSDQTAIMLGIPVVDDNAGEENKQFSEYEFRNFSDWNGDRIMALRPKDSWPLGLQTPFVSVHRRYDQATRPSAISVFSLDVSTINDSDQANADHFQITEKGSWLFGPSASATPSAAQEILTSQGPNATPKWQSLGSLNLKQSIGMFNLSPGTGFAAGSAAFSDWQDVVEIMNDGDVSVDSEGLITLLTPGIYKVSVIGQAAFVDENGATYPSPLQVDLAKFGTQVKRDGGHPTIMIPEQSDRSAHSNTNATTSVGEFNRFTDEFLLDYRVDDTPARGTFKVGAFLYIDETTYSKASLVVTVVRLGG